MTQVCLVGESDVELRHELLARETSRKALSSFGLDEPFENAIAVDTISLGAAVALLNDLNWYLTRFAADAIVLEPSVSDAEWLSRDLATAVRNDEIAPDATDEWLKIYGVEAADGRRRLVEPLFARRVGDDVPAYDLRDVDDTVVVRVTPEQVE